MANDRFDFYKDAAGEWRWRKISPNGKIIGASSQGFSSKQAAVHNAQLNGYQGG